MQKFEIKHKTQQKRAELMKHFKENEKNEDRKYVAQKLKEKQKIKLGSKKERDENRDILAKACNKNHEAEAIEKDEIDQLKDSMKQFQVWE